MTISNTSEIETTHSFINFLSALKPSRASLSLYAKILTWLVFVYLVGIYAERIGGIAFLPALIRLGFIYLSLRIVLDVIALLINFFYRKRNRRPDTYTDSFTVGITRLSKAFFWFVFGLFLIDLFIPIKTLLGSLTIAIAVTGLAFRDFVTNFVNGMNIMFSGKFQLGEYVQIGDSKGRIKDLTFTHVHLQTEAQDMVFIPNNLVLAKEVVNFSKNKAKNVLVRMVVDKAHYGYYQELCWYIVANVSEKFPNQIIKPDDIKIRVESLEKDSMNWLIEYRVSHYDFALETSLKNFTAEIVVEFLNNKEKEKKTRDKKTPARLPLRRS